MNQPEPTNTQEQAPPSATGGRNRWVGLAMILFFDLGGPLAAYSVLRSNGISEVLALALSGVFPAVGVLIDWVRHRTLDVIGVVVLSGVLIGVVLAAVTHSSRAVLLEGAVPTAVFAFACLISLRARRPLMYRFAQGSMGGPASGPGRAFDQRYEQQPGMRHYFRLATLVWGVAFLIEAAIKIVVTQTTSTGVAFTVSRLLPYPIVAVLAVWMIVWGRYARRRGAQRAAAQQAASPGSSTT